MAQEKAALRVTELDFLSIRDNLKTYLQSQDEFQDFDFEGSGMAVLLDILAYNTHYMGYYLNMVGNESFLDTAQLRESILSHAKHIGYVPGSKRGAKSRININVTPSDTEDQSATTLRLEKYTKLLGADIDGVNYPFVTCYSNTSTKSGSSFAFSNIYITQGEVVTLQYPMLPSNTQRRFEIPSANVDLSTVSITVQQSSSNTDTVQYTLADDITEVTGNSTVYFIEENENLNYTFYFGDDVIGKKPQDGSIVICTYIDTVGLQGNSISFFTFVEPIGGAYSDNVAVLIVDASYGGRDKETVEQVRFRAPYFYTAQNRAVTKNDYETLIMKDYTNIDSVSVWGGEENDPVVYGKVYLSLKTRGNYYLTELEKENIKDTLIRTRNILTVTPEIVDPNYIYVVIKAKIYFNPRLTSRTANEIEALVRAAIYDYNDDELNTFNSTFRKSKLQSYIENCEKSITGSDVNIFLQKRLPLELNTRDNYTFSFNASLSKGEYNRKLSSFPSINVLDVNGITRTVYFEEVQDSFTGISEIDVVNPGRNYQTAPTVSITGDGTGATATAYIINGRVDRIVIDNPGINYTRAFVTLTGGGGSEATAEASIENNFGTIRSYYFTSLGEKVIVDSEAGTIDYRQGKITLTELYPLAVTENDSYDENILTIDAPPESQTIFPLRNRILSIDENNPSSIVIEMIPE